MRAPASDKPFICPNCHMPVDPTKPDAMLSAATQQWQHKNCWTLSLKRKAIDLQEIQSPQLKPKGQ